MEGSHVFVFGAPHSGTTIAYRMLAFHPDLGWPSQFSLRAGQVPGRRRVPMAAALDRTLRRLPHRWVKRGDSALRTYLVPTPVEARTVWEHVLDGGPGGEQRLRDVLARLAGEQRSRRLLFKLPELDRHLDLLRMAAPGARLLHLVRDGRAVALSLRSKFARRLPDGEALEAAAAHWREVTSRATAAGGETVELRYEDLCEDIHGTLRGVMEACGLAPERFPFDRCPQRLPATNARHISAATPAELARITAIQEGQLRRYSYLRDPLPGGGTA